MTRKKRSRSARLKSPAAARPPASRAVDSGAAWTCPGCRAALATKFCPTCGEQSPSGRALSLRSLLALLASGLTSVDSRLVRSLRLLIGRPGALTSAYVEGLRKPYWGPFQLFLLLNALLFAVQSGTHTNIFSSPLDSHLHQQDWSALAQELVGRRLERLHTTVDAYRPIFDHAVARNAKALIVLMTVPFAGLLALVFLRARRPFGAHAVFALHLYSFLLLLFCVSLAIAAVDAQFGGQGLGSARMDNVLTVLNLVACAIYLYFAIGAVYGARGVLRGAQAAVLALSVVALVLGYRMLVFLITLYTT